jgi:hypothetical protein
MCRGVRRGYPTADCTFAGAADGRQNNARSTVITGGPNAIICTHADEANRALLDFIDRPG